MVTMASMMSKYSWLKFTDVTLLTMCVVTCAQTSNQKDQVLCRALTCPSPISLQLRRATLHFFSLFFPKIAQGKEKNSEMNDSKHFSMDG